ncbi:MAG: hypothetical protein H0W22_06250, partial [Chloroflexi bacterium]|nr:hypothetical protein [Chloroflexota bacterium]
MNEDPLFSGGMVKVALIILTAGLLGVGAYALVDGIDLPDIDLDELGETTTNLSDTDLSDTTIGDAPEEPPPDAGDPFTSASFGSALDAVKAEAGPGRKLTRLFINPVQTQFIVVKGDGDGDGIEAFSVRSDDSKEVVREEATITISGNATLEDFAFSLDAVDPSAIDRMLAAAKKRSGAGDFEPTVVSLERRIPFGERALEWTINAEGGGRNLLYRAKPDGSEVRDSGGG